jgi:hypothetical protein
LPGGQGADAGAPLGCQQAAIVVYVRGLRMLRDGGDLERIVRDGLISFPSRGSLRRLTVGGQATNTGK